MVHIIELQRIVNALNGSFLNRNSYFTGYWAISQLKSFAINNALSSLTF